ncbi:iron-containing redox enzyme family protein [Actinoplanes sp. KI2]|uniref:iron-containing redox enzyme family protein n=1 Tax=Actinoplanes sp. KI2 TaxID=2983315 RepID=UPI0021D578FD|nr:iron-containing redox enzyme family protein [Actinoplanes sp. KI2]MCU7730687.1 iron-containing redox enzyme family protein [Actinoplanes sp. KI2]
MRESSRPAAATLRATIAPAAPTLRAASARLWQRPGLSGRYREYLCAMHAVVRASVPVMELAADRCVQLVDDPVGGPLRAYLRRHIEEERGHDDWLVADLADLAAGSDPVALLAQPPSAAAALVGPQYYWIAHAHPVAVLGYIAVLEGNAPAVRLVDRLTSAGIPERAVRTVREHAVLDAGHAEQVFDLLDELPLTGAQLRLVSISALQTAQALAGLYADVLRRHPPT